MTRLLAAGVCVPHPSDPTLVGATSRRSSDARDVHTATAPGQRAAYAYGAVCRSLEAACRRVWPSAIAYDPYQPSVWRSLVGAGGSGKAGAMRVARIIAGPGVPLTQDEADAICIARALIIEHYDWKDEA